MPTTNIHYPMTKPGIILIGAGGHAHACIDLIGHQGRHKLAGRLANGQPAHCQSNYWLQTLLLDAYHADQRDAVLKATHDNGFMTRPAWILMHELEPFKDCPHAQLSGAVHLAATIVNIPSSTRLWKKP